VEPARCLGSVLLHSIYFTTLWSDGLRSLLLLVVYGLFGLHNQTARACPIMFGLSARTVRLMHNR
jgi:hypothetical protein